MKKNNVYSAGTTCPDLPQRRDTFSATFVCLAALFCVCLIVSNILEIKTVDIGPLTITAGVIVFPVSYMINDCIVEVYGFRKARLVIWLGFGLSLLTIILIHLGMLLPGSSEWDGQEAMERVFMSVPRILAASFVAFICGSMVNAWVMARMKKPGMKGFSLRAIVSTLWGEGVDSVIFFPIAFAGVLPWGMIVTLVVTQALIKTLYEVLALPLTRTAVAALLRLESRANDVAN